MVLTSGRFFFIFLLLTHEHPVYSGRLGGDEMRFLIICAHFLGPFKAQKKCRFCRAFVLILRPQDVSYRLVRYLPGTSPAFGSFSPNSGGKHHDFRQKTEDGVALE